MKRPLQELLSTDPSEIIEDGDDDVVMSDEKEPLEEGLCIECGDQPSELQCTNCDEPFCQVCYDYIHRTGSRKSHSTKPLVKQEKHNNKTINVAQAAESIDQNQDEDQDQDGAAQDEDQNTDEARMISNVAHTLISTRGEANHDKTVLLKKIKEHARFIPMRLTHDERKLLRLLEAALNVSEYTDRVDVLIFGSKAKRMIAQLKEMCGILTGLVVATDMKTGQELFQNKEFSANADWFKKVFEIGRRYKIMNPEKMRDSFGKLMYMIMDSRRPEIKEAMDFDLHMPINTVHKFLESRSALELLDDPLVLQAVVEIIPDGGKSRASIQREIRTKEHAIESLARKHFSPGNISKEEIRQALYSIGDYHAYLRANCNPIEQMIKHLHNYFDPDQVEESQFSLGISSGVGGARLSHNHYKQFQYVNQSLTLWSQIQRDMFMLWTLADHDLTSSEHQYQLTDTGQGLNRVKSCPFVHRAMHGIIRKTQERTGKWIGSSVVHLGDDAVPNALMFLDKYLQVPRILTPVFMIVSKLDQEARDPYVRDWIEAKFDSVDGLKKTILCDFFKFAFDGSGAEDFYNAGSCIDGRLTSAWNWTNRIHKKPFYKHFLITGFTGFDGTEGF